MSNTVLDLAPQTRSLVEVWGDPVEMGAQGKGFRDRRSRQSEALFETSFVAQFGPGTNSYETTRDHFFTHRGAFESFLWKPIIRPNRFVSGEALGTGDGVEDEFALDHVHVDPASLVVYLDGSPTSAYTLTGNHSAPIVDFDSPPGGAVAITADYDRYIPVLWIDSRFPVRPKTDAAEADVQVVISDQIRLRQDSPGSHKVSA